jgi:hypothetical protein
MKTENSEVEKVNDHFEHKLKEAAHWYGGFDNLRKVIDMLEENSKEDQFYKSQNNHAY